jgi:hypothetical protein
MTRRAILILLALACLAGATAAAIVAVGHGAAPSPGAVANASPAPAASVRSRPAHRAARSHRRAHAHKASASPPAPARSPGSLPQTDARPSARTPRFHAQMRALWAGILSGSSTPALGAFFPRGAYAQLKAIPGASADWSGRLVRDYGLDIRAAHALLGGDRAARLIAVVVPSSYAHWVPPGVCLNGLGYFEVPNARVVYQAHGAVRSFGIASMISWRGVWYVVHLGAILRPSDSGEVDAPSSGRGVSSYSGTC